MNILFIGGDKRMLFAKDYLNKNGYKTDSLGLIENDNGKIETADIIILPVPTSKDNKNIFCPLTNKEIPLKTIDKANENAIIFSANYKISNKRNIDYLKLDGYAILNAVPTAEGAISAAIENTDFTIWKSKTLVIGNGRTGKILAERLNALKANVTVSARKFYDFSLIDSFGLKYIETENIKETAKKYDIIFNTIDVELQNDVKKQLENILIIDLSSKGCITEEDIKKYNLKYIKLPGIPGKTAAKTAGNIISQTVIDILKKEKMQ